MSDHIVRRGTLSPIALLNYRLMIINFFHLGDNLAYFNISDRQTADSLNFLKAVIYLPFLDGCIFWNDILQVTIQSFSRTSTGDRRNIKLTLS